MINNTQIVFEFDVQIPTENASGENKPQDSAANYIEETVDYSGTAVTRIIGEFWTARQRQASNLHEVSYRACFKPQLPAYFIERYTKPGDVVLDPFSGRGTTAIEAALRGRKVIANDVNPLSVIFARPRLSVPANSTIENRLAEIPYVTGKKAEIDLSMFYEANTESEIVCLREYLNNRRETGLEDAVDEWIRMVSTNRLTGHSPGFFSVYSLPPNQAASSERQKKINIKLNQLPEYRDTKRIIIKKSKQLLNGLTEIEISNLHTASRTANFVIGEATNLLGVKDSSVSLTVTSPPFLKVVQYAADNWLRCWFNDLLLSEVAPQITMADSVKTWSKVMSKVFFELYRVTKEGGIVAFEVGEVKNGKVKLEEVIVPLGIQAGFNCELVMINTQQFTKTANIWGVKNNEIGTNSNRIVIFRKTL